MYGKLENGALVECTLKSVVIDGVFIRPVPTSWYDANGWKEVVETAKPDDGFDYTLSYTEDADKIYRVWTKITEGAAARQRKHEYENKLCITWGDQRMTVDQANQLYLAYLAEGRSVSELSSLIASAKASIRASIPDTEV